MSMARMDSCIRDKKKGKSMDDAVKSNENIRNMQQHKMDLDKLLDQYGTSLDQGLSDEHAARLLTQNGPNALTERQGLPWYCVFAKELTGFFSLLLWFGAFLCFIGYGLQPKDKSNLYLGIVLSSVVFVTGLFSFYQTSRSASLMAQFKNFIPPLATVRRHGENKSIEASKLVIGDIVIIKGGDNIPADIRVTVSNEMKVNNASLTGESEDLLRKPDEFAENPLDSKNLVFFGTSCTEGSGEGVVILTGNDTVIGEIANLAQSAESGETPLSQEIHRFIKIISAVAIFLGVVFFLFGVGYGYDVITNLVFAIGIIVANVPEGLLATVTVTLALTAKRMATKKVLVKNLESVETLGSTSCICSDKTGTLTQNVMTVSNMFYDQDLKDCSVNYEEQQTELRYDINDPAMKEIIKCVILGTTASFGYIPTEDEIKRQIAKILEKAPSKVTDQDLLTNTKKATQQLQEDEDKRLYKHKKTVGDASESGLIKFIQPIQDLTQFRDKYPIHQYTNKDQKDEIVVCSIPFSSNLKFNLMIREVDGGLTIIMKGAPERIIDRCSNILLKGTKHEYFTEAQRNQVLGANKELAALGERVLAFASIDLDPIEYPLSYAFNMDPNKPNFPMDNLTFIGLVSLNDPPRLGVDNSVLKCRQAGIKVIMVTGDQETTAAAIAHKVGIIKENNTTKVCILNKETIKDEDMIEDKLERAVAVVVHGDVLAIKHAAEEELDMNDPEKGRFLLNWIKKEEVVFARTTPAQKLLIVDGCQKAGHVVAVTGDGVNDSPAIKKADIGIAMGICGSDVAKNAADMLLLDDNFCSIVNGVEEGRLIFDNLKKSIAYTLSSNIPEIGPFISFILFQLPLPLSTVLILCIDLGTDMVPAISFAYENPELDIMDRKPRNSKRDHLVNTKLIAFAYLQIGVIQCSAGFFTYFCVMNDYGFPPSTLFFFSNDEGVVPNATDIYDPTATNHGNTGVVGGNEKRTLDWIYDKDDKIDVRLFFYAKPDSSWTTCRFNSTDYPKFWRISSVTDHQICYSTEALKYAQCAYLVTIVVVQWADLMICKTRNLSISQQGMSNIFSNIGLFFETALVALLCYLQPLNIALGTRQIASPHFAVIAFPFFTFIFFYDECRKMFLREGIIKHGEKNLYNGWIARNTYY